MRGATVTHDGKTHTLHEWLRDERELTRIARPLLVQVAKQANVDISELLGNASAHGQTHGQLPGVRRARPAIRRNGPPDALVVDAASGDRPRVFDRVEPRGGGR